MKNVYLAIIILLLSFGAVAQNLQNANWYFGDHAGLNFNSGVPVELTDMPTSTPFYSLQLLEGVASVSSKSGNLLFYTDGVYVYNRNHVIMPANGLGSNTLFGNPSSSQNSVISPWPGHNNKFFVITKDGSSGQSLGLHYSIIDMTLNGGLGDIIEINTPLKDHLGQLITANYTYTYPYNINEQITTSFCNDGVNYWLVTRIDNYLYSYKITSSGIGNSNMPNQTYPITQTGSSPTLSFLKISPDATKIASTHVSTGTNANGFIVGSFNNSTGIISNVSTIPRTSPSPKGIEFSPNNQYLYMIWNFSSPISTTVEKYDFNTNTKTVVGSISNVFGYGLQRAVDNKIYFTDNTHRLSVITSPDNSTNPGFVVNAITLTRQGAMGLPQWVYWYDQECESITLTSEPNISFVYNQKSDITTQTAYYLDSGDDITMKAENFIVLKPDTHIGSGSKLWVKIEDCGTIIEARIANNTISKEAESVKIDDDLNLFPNPANEKVTISSGSAIAGVTISSMENMVMFQKDFSGKEASVDVYIRDYKKGIYLVTVITTDGEVHTSKLIKY